MRKTIATLLVMLMVFSVAAIVVQAKGGTSGGSITKNVAQLEEDERPNCEDEVNMKSRIECRLQFGQVEETTPEPCRLVPSKKDKCTGYYSDILPCYEKDGVEKDMCFKDVATFEKVGVSMQLAANDNPWPVELYILGLLYDLEEKVEDSYAANDISASEGAALIAEIVDIKVQVLERDSPSNIKASVTILRNKWPAGVQ